jgi:hypothetical protein
VRRRATVIATLGALSLAACGGDGDDGAASQEPAGAIDTRVGTYRGVGIGDDVATMHREFGPQAPAAEGERIEARSPEGEQDYGPRTQTVHGSTAALSGSAESSRAEKKYGLRCGTAYEGSEYEEYPACTGRIAARRHIWFGGDPIRNVTVAITPLGGL